VQEGQEGQEGQEVVQLDVGSLRAEIDRAFGKPMLPASVADMLAEPYRKNDDAHELAVVLFGYRWGDVPVRDLFRHREMLFALSPAAFRTYLPAYLVACLVSVDPLDEYGADLREYLIDSLTVSADATVDRQATTRARIAALNTDQRTTAASVVRYLETRWRVRGADAALRSLS
jgi:hypothetical protein